MLQKNIRLTCKCDNHHKLVVLRNKTQLISLRVWLTKLPIQKKKNVKMIMSLPFLILRICTRHNINTLRLQNIYTFIRRLLLSFNPLSTTISLRFGLPALCQPLLCPSLLRAGPANSLARRSMRRSEEGLLIHVCLL